MTFTVGECLVFSALAFQLAVILMLWLSDDDPNSPET